MCEKQDTIQFCSCDEHLDLSTSKKDEHYIWILERVVSTNHSGMLGLTLLPARELDQMKPEFIVQELNTKNLFDFDYQPQDDDSLRIEHVNRSKKTEREYLYGEYLNFRYYKNKWHIGQVSPFSYILEIYKDGKVKLGKG